MNVNGACIAVLITAGQPVDEFTDEEVLAAWDFYDENNMSCPLDLEVECISRGFYLKQTNNKDSEDVN